MLLPQQPHIIWSLRDGSGSMGMVRAYVRAGAEVAPAHAAADARRALLMGVSGCAFTRQSLIYSSVEAAPAAPAPAARAGAAGVLMFSCGEPRQLGLVALPGLYAGLLVSEGCATGVDIDTAHPDVMALVAHLLTGDYCNPFGYELTRLVAGYLQERQ